MTPLDWLSWLIVGVLAGWLVSLIMKSRLHFGLLVDVLVGVLGALLGGFALSLGGVSASLAVGLVAAFLGAFLLVSLPRVVYALTH